MTRIHCQLYCLLSLLTSTVFGVRWTYNPGCDDDTVCGDANMVHVQTKYNQYLWSSQNGVSAIVFSGNQKLSVNWTEYNGEGTGSISVSTPSSFGLTFKSLRLENTTTSENQTIDLADLDRYHIDIDNSTFSGKDLVFGYKNKFMSVKINVSDAIGRMELLPRLKFTENSTLVDVKVDLTKISGLKVVQPDLAVLVVETVSMNNLTESKSHSFDDEATPALFNYEILSDELYNDTDHQGIYVMWRPVVYVGRKRLDISKLELIHLIQTPDPTPALITKYYSKPIYEMHLKVSPPDGKKFLSDTFAWTLAMGQGEPQKETLSLVGTILILVVVALPCLALILGVALVAYRRKAAHPGDGYRAI